jgi:hypothetical protein
MNISRSDRVTINPFFYIKITHRLYLYTLELSNATVAETTMNSYEANIRGTQNTKIDRIYLSSTHSHNKPATYLIKALEEVMEVL